MLRYRYYVMLVVVGIFTVWIEWYVSEVYLLFQSSFGKLARYLSTGILRRGGDVVNVKCQVSVCLLFSFLSLRHEMVHS